MGASVSAKVSTVTSAISNEVNKESSATATCDSSIKGTLISFGGDFKGCKIKLANNCVASAEAASNSVISGATKALNSASQKTKTGFGISASMSSPDIKSFVSSKLNESCDTDAKVNNSIEDSVIMINGDCEEGEIVIVNTGNAKANCMTKAVLDTINQAEDSSKSDTTGFGGDIVETVGKNPFGSGISSIVCSYSSCCSICIILLVLGVIAYMNFGMDMDMGMEME